MLTRFMLMLFFVPYLCYGTIIYDYYLDDIKAHREKFRDNVRLLYRNDPGYVWYDRVLLTASCGDCDYVPKVPDAGKIIDTPQGPYQLMHNGVKVVKDCYCGGGWVTDLIYGLKGQHEPQEEKVFYEVLKYIPSNGVMIELGSYWAYYSLWFAHEIPNARNYMVEPDLKSLNIGKKNFELNNLTGTFVHGYAAVRDNDAIDYTGARRVSIDSFLNEQNIDHLNILHADIQGAEYEMLLSCRESMVAGKIDFFFVSTHSEWLHSSCLQVLRNYGYTIIAEHSPAQSVSCDGLIAAKRPGVEGPENVTISKH